MVKFRHPGLMITHLPTAHLLALQHFSISYPLKIWQGTHHITLVLGLLFYIQDALAFPSRKKKDPRITFLLLKKIRCRYKIVTCYNLISSISIILGYLFGHTDKWRG
jgi:hypothetical protein